MTQTLTPQTHIMLPQRPHADNDPNTHTTNTHHVATTASRCSPVLLLSLPRSLSLSPTSSVGTSGKLMLSPCPRISFSSDMTSSSSCCDNPPARRASISCCTSIPSLVSSIMRSTSSRERISCIFFSAALPTWVGKNNTIDMSTVYLLSTCSCMSAHMQCINYKNKCTGMHMYVCKYDCKHISAGVCICRYV